LSASSATFALNSALNVLLVRDMVGISFCS
jgi:hypothetical protein